MYCTPGEAGLSPWATHVLDQPPFPPPPSQSSIGGGVLKLTEENTTTLKKKKNEISLVHRVYKHTAHGISGTTNRHVNMFNRLKRK